ncbi:MAG: ABC transporter permease [Acidobacteriaceae bacterium]
MRWLAKFRMVLLTLFRRRAGTERLNDELEFHVRQQIDENMARGMNADEARSAALRNFGNLTLVRELARSEWSWGWLEKFGRDLRYGARTLRRSPGFSVIAILVMALGIGATASLFTIVNAVLLKPLPFHDPDRLVMAYEHFRAAVSNAGGFNYNWVSAADFRDWRAQTHSFQDMAAWRLYGFNLIGEHAELPEGVAAAGGSWNLFHLLGVPMALGRSFTAEEDQPGANHVAILSWSLYQRRFNGDPSVLGKQIRLDTVPYAVVGVLPRWFTYPDATVQLWVPYASTFTPELYARHDAHGSHVIARLLPGTSAAAAVKPVSAVQYRLHLANLSAPVAEDAVTRPMIDDVVKDIKTPLIVLLCAVGCMLLIACLNVSNLLVARGAARRKEVAVRGALGGSRVTLILEQMTESLLICIVGGGLGLLLSLLATHWLASHLPDLPRANAIHVDGTVLAFSLGIALLAALIAGLLPALSSTGKDVFSALQDSSRAVGGSASRASLRKILLSAEIALTVILLVSAGLLFKSFLHLRTADLGCVTDHVLTMKYGLPMKEYDAREKVIAFHESLLERVRRLPGVRAAALVSTPPGDGYENDRVFTIPSRPSTSFQLQDDALIRCAGPNYFHAMQIPLLRGRVFTQQERLIREHYIVVSKMFADQFFPNANPIGEDISILWGGKMIPENFEIIGVVGDTVWDVAQPIMATVYFPILSGVPQESSNATLVVRTAGDPLAMSIPIQKQFAALDPSLPISDILTMQQIVNKSTAGQSFNATLVLAFAGLSLLLAAIGLYGVLSYLVTQRVKEIGIRIALGAQRSQVLSLVLLDGLRPVFVGLAIGIAGGVTAGALIRSMLYGTSPLDPLVFTAMVGCLLLTAVAACVIPAIRASHIDPMQALRAE